MNQLTLGLALLSMTFAGSLARAADFVVAPDDARPLMHLSTDATDIACDLYVTVGTANELTGATYACSSHPDTFKRYTLDDLKKGITFSKGDFEVKTNGRLDLVTISAPAIDASQGGDVNAHYISNGITGAYADYGFTVNPSSGAWAAYTSQDAGNERFDQIFMKKKTAFGQTIGVSCIAVSQSPAQPSGCRKLR